MTSYCAKCDRSYASETALQQHLRSSRAHALSFDCHDCNRSFYSEEALQNHLQNSRAHVPLPFDCSTCDRRFEREEDLAKHLLYSRVHQHQRNVETPLDVFFRSFQNFDYDPSLPPATSFANLQRHGGWRRESDLSRNAWDRYQDALQRELAIWFGAEDDLTAWHALCRAIGVQPLPRTCEKCEQVGNSATPFDRFMLTKITGCTKNTRQYCWFDWMGPEWQYRKGSDFL